MSQRKDESDHYLVSCGFEALIESDFQSFLLLVFGLFSTKRSENAADAEEEEKKLFYTTMGGRRLNENFLSRHRKNVLSV